MSTTLRAAIADRPPAGTACTRPGVDRDHRREGPHPSGRVAAMAARSAGHHTPVKERKGSDPSSRAVAGAPSRTTPDRPSTPTARPETSGLCGQPAGSRVLLLRGLGLVSTAGCPENQD